MILQTPARRGAFILTIVGDSMAPYYPAGTEVVVDVQPLDVRCVGDACLVRAANGKEFFARLADVDENRATFTLDGKAGRAVYVKLRDIDSIAYAVHVARPRAACVFRSWMAEQLRF